MHLYAHALPPSLSPLQLLTALDLSSSTVRTERSATPSAQLLVDMQIMQTCGLAEAKPCEISKFSACRQTCLQPGATVRDNCCCEQHQDGNVTIAELGGCITNYRIEGFTHSDASGSIDIVVLRSDMRSIRSVCTRRASPTDACACLQIWVLDRAEFEHARRQVAEGGDANDGSICVIPETPAPSADASPIVADNTLPPRPSGAGDDSATCVDETYLRAVGFDERHFVHRRSVMARVLCPLHASVPCGTAQHKLRVDGVDGSYGWFCARRLVCETRWARVNAVYAHRWTERREGDVVVTMFDVRYSEMAQTAVHRVLCGARLGWRMVAGGT